MHLDRILSDYWNDFGWYSGIDENLYIAMYLTNTRVPVYCSNILSALVVGQLLKVNGAVLFHPLNAGAE